MKNPTDKGWVVLAALSGAISVITGAFAAHGLDPHTEAGLKAREWVQTGSQYEVVHALAMIGVAALSRIGPGSSRLGDRLALAALWLFLIGSVFFPGALYALALGGPRWFGAVAPLGGLAFILGWLSLAGAALRK